VKEVAWQIECRLIPPPNRAQSLVIIRQMVRMVEQIEELRGQLYHAEQTVRAGRQAAANIHDALLRGEDDATLLRMMTEAYGPKVGCGGTAHNVKLRGAPLLARPSRTPCYAWLAL
jgi:hypothetical protein